jgi:hypothetical protein
MTKFKGTHGKWVIKELYNRLETEISCGDIRIASANHYNYGIDDWTKNDPEPKQGRANAILISKAPEMLEMLKNILLILETPNAVINILPIQNLIKEATND